MADPIPTLTVQQLVAALSALDDQDAEVFVELVENTGSKTPVVAGIRLEAAVDCGLINTTERVALLRRSID